MEEIWEVDDAASVVRYIEDHFVRAIYLLISGERRKESEQFIRQNLDIMPEQELWRDARNGKNKEREQAIKLLAAILDSFNPEFAEILEQATEDRHPKVREAVLLSVGLLAWPELWPLVLGCVERKRAILMSGIKQKLCLRHTVNL